MSLESSPNFNLLRSKRSLSFDNSTCRKVAPSSLVSSTTNDRISMLNPIIRAECSVALSQSNVPSDVPSFNVGRGVKVGRHRRIRCNMNHVGSGGRNRCPNRRSPSMSAKRNPVKPSLSVYDMSHNFGLIVVFVAKSRVVGFMCFYPCSVYWIIFTFFIRAVILNLLKIVSRFRIIFLVYAVLFAQP